MDFVAWIATLSRDDGGEPGSGFALSQRSLRELVGVHPSLVGVVKRAIELTPQDFVVFDGIRTLAEQRKHVQSGASHTLHSRHLPQGADNLGKAVDLVPIIGGRIKWDWHGECLIAGAMQAAGRELEVPLVWGGVWDKLLEHLGPDKMAEIRAYQARFRRTRGRDAFVDGPHFQLPKSLYP